MYTFFQISSKIFPELYSKEVERWDKQNIEERISTSFVMSICGRQAATMDLWNGWEVMEKYTQTQDKHHAKPTATGLYLSPEFNDCFYTRSHAPEKQRSPECLQHKKTGALIKICIQFDI